MDETAGIKELFGALKKRVILITVITSLAALASGIISIFYLAPVYQTSTQLLVNQSKNKDSLYSYNEVQTNLQLVNTYSVIIKSPAILDIVRRDLNLNITTEELIKKVSVESEQDTQVVNLKVKDNDPKLATDIANKITSVFQTEIYKIMNVDNVKVLAKATLPDSPVEPNPIINIAIAIVVAFMSSVGLAFLLQYLDNTIKTEKDIEMKLNMPVLGVISRMAKGNRRKGKGKEAGRQLVTILNPKAPISEQYRTLRTNIQFSSVDIDLRSIVVTSQGPAEGKSTTAANLAAVLSQQGKKVLLVDADLRKPTIHYTFNLMNTVGLTNVITKSASLKDAVNQTSENGLHVLTSGPIPPNPAELLSSKSMEALIGEFVAEYEIVLFDTPPVLAVTDAQILSNKCDGTILVVSSEKSEKEKVKMAKDLLLSVKGQLLGSVLNNRKGSKNQYYYYGTKN